MNNTDFFSGLSSKVYRDFDAGEISEQRKGLRLQVWVNAPGVMQAMNSGRDYTVEETTDAQGKPSTLIHYAPTDEGEEYRRKRQVVAILYERPFDEIQKLDDTLIEWLWLKGSQLYREYHDELKNGLRTLSLSGVIVETITTVS